MSQKKFLEDLLANKWTKKKILEDLSADKWGKKSFWRICRLTNEPKNELLEDMHG